MGAEFALSWRINAPTARRGLIGWITDVWCELAARLLLATVYGNHHGVVAVDARGTVFCVFQRVFTLYLLVWEETLGFFLRLFWLKGGHVYVFFLFLITLYMS